MKRFSKAVLRDWIDAECGRLIREHQIDPGNGTAQLDGRNRAAILAYGEYTALRRIGDKFDVGVPR